MLEGPLSGEPLPFIKEDDIEGSGIGSWIANLGKKIITSDKVRSAATSAAKSGANALLGKGADAAKAKILSSGRFPESVKTNYAELPAAATNIVREAANITNSTPVSDAVCDVANVVKDVGKDEAVKQLKNYLALPTKVGMGIREIEELNKIKKLLYKNE